MKRISKLLTQPANDKTTTHDTMDATSRARRPERSADGLFDSMKTGDAWTYLSFKRLLDSDSE
jgi:hypothetical protein